MTWHYVSRRSPLDDIILSKTSAHMACQRKIYPNLTIQPSGYRLSLQIWFKRKGIASLEYKTKFSSICSILLPSDRRVSLVILILSPLCTIWPGIPPQPCSLFHRCLLFHHRPSIMRFNFWLYDCLDHFEGVSKHAGVYEAVWAARFKQPLDPNFLKAFIPQWSPHINTILTYYRELGIYLWHAFPITGLPIVGGCMTSSSPLTSFLWTKDTLHLFKGCFAFGGVCSLEISKIHWVGQRIHTGEPWRCVT